MKEDPRAITFPASKNYPLSEDSQEEVQEKGKENQTLSIDSQEVYDSARAVDQLILEIRAQVKKMNYYMGEMREVQKRDRV